MAETREKFSVAFSWLIEKKKIVQKDFAALCGMSPSSITDYKTGRREGDEDTREKISGLLGYEYRDFLHLGQWILDSKDPEEWKPPLRGHLPPMPPVIPAQGITRDILDPSDLGQKSPAEMLSSLPTSQKYQEAKDVLVSGIGIPEDEADKLLMKHMGLPPTLTTSLPEDKRERFMRIWEYACTTHQKLKEAAWPGDKEIRLNRYLDGELDDVGVYLEAIGWLKELFRSGGEID
ncbi:helix-turn-helix transcriptional regulator [Desulfobulbus sp.]|uniref:helix-turn-helix domain-containing protein n=1 Tax=Desulfobulbus sp. TaxID=895 RepID=UPI00286F017F|nr:helix-turn-helix transcriptional regulator [Desulfobulbus sp.]